MLHARSLTALSVECLETREVPALVAQFSALNGGVLNVFGDGQDNLIVVERSASGAITVNGGTVKVIGAAPTTANTAMIQIFGQGGNDRLRLDETNGPLPAAQLFGGAGDDILVGGTGADALFGQDGNDQLTGGAGDDLLFGQSGADAMFGGTGADQAAGGAGDDVAFMGAGNDQFTWNPGDGSDRVEGEAGFDSVHVNGSGGDEVFGASATGTRLRLTRDTGIAVTNADGVESVTVSALGGADTVALNDLTGTAVQEVIVDLAGGPNGSTADDKADRVVLNGTTGDDFIDVLAFGGLSVLGLPTFVTVRAASPTDELVINGLAGDDRIEAGSMSAGAIAFTADGGAGDDTISGTNGADVLIGGSGSDFVDGHHGDDIVFLGAGDLDLFNYRAGDGNDRIDGGAGRDALVMSGSAAGEQIALSAVGNRFQVTRDTDSAALNTSGLESFSFFSFGGADTVVVNDLTGTGVDQIDLSLFDFAVPDGGKNDSVVINGTAGADDVTAAMDAQGAVTVSGLAARVRITGTDAANDVLQLNGLGGDDSVDGTLLNPAEMQLRIDGGAGADVLLGGDGSDVLFGGAGADVLFAGAGDNVVLGGAGDDVLRGEEGDDVLDGGPGDDILIGGAGDDILLNGEVVFDE